MGKLTGCNYDVNEELPQVTDPETPDDGEFEAWLDSLNERTANGGADRLPMKSRKQLFFASLKANGWTPKSATRRAVYGSFLTRARRAKTIDKKSLYRARPHGRHTLSPRRGFPPLNPPHPGTPLKSES